MGWSGMTGIQFSQMNNFALRIPDLTIIYDWRCLHYVIDFWVSASTSARTKNNDRFGDFKHILFFVCIIRMTHTYDKD